MNPERNKSCIAEAAAVTHPLRSSSFHANPSSPGHPFEGWRDGLGGAPDPAERESGQRPADRLRTLLNALPAAVVVLDGKGRVQQDNPAARQLLGEPLVGQAWRDVILRAFEPDAPDGELALKDGRLVSLSTCPLGSEPGQILLLHEVTEERRLRQGIQQQQRLVDMGRMAASLAHQVRTPLASALLYVSQLKEPRLEQEQRLRFVDKAVARLKDLERLVNDMLVYAGGGAGGDELMEPAGLLRRVLDSLAERVEASGTRVALVGEAPERLIRGNRVLLESSLQNLVTNAIQAMGDGGCLHLIARPASGGNVDLMVRDDGPGIPEALQTRVFEPFETTRAGGTGLGLAVARAVARAHRGELWLESRPGAGSTFSLRLPAVDRHPGDTGARNQRPAPPNDRKSNSR